MAELLLKHRGLVQAVVARFLWDRTAWEDVVQNIFTKVVGSMCEFSGRCRFSTWLYRIAVNECMEANRRHMRWARRMDGKESSVDVFADPNAPDGLTETIREEIHSAVRETISRLPDAMRRAFELFYARQYTGAEAARELDITVQAFFVRLSAARNKVKQELQSRGIVPW